MKRSTSFIIILFIYLLAFLLGYLAYILLPIDNKILKVIICDIIATIIVFIFSVIFRNSSIYDPYWSVAPLCIIPFFINDFSLKQMLMLTVIVLWGIRLTLNWAYTFKGLNYQDWRYSFYRDKFPKLWPIVNFFGIHLMPTVIVILVMIPSLLFLQSEGSINIYTYIGASLSLIAISLELIADTQMHSFRKNKKGIVNENGLWKYSRHPNYLGEITMWWGVFIMMISIIPYNLIYIIGPIANTFLFIFVSIPLMERRQLKNKPEYQIYKDNTSMLFILPKKSSFKKIKSWAKKIKTNVLALYLVLKRKDVHWLVKGYIGLIVGYALSPIDLIPDFIPIIGYLDDVIILPLLILLAIKIVPKSVFEECKEQALILYANKRPKSKIAAIIIVIIWVGILSFLIYNFYDDIINLFK